MEAEKENIQTPAGTPVMNVEVAYATPQRQMIVKLQVPEGTTVGEAIKTSGLAARFPSLDPRAEVGIFSRKVTRDQLLKAGDRVEIYRPLMADPKENRRQKAQSEKTVRTRSRNSRKPLQ